MLRRFTPKRGRAILRAYDWLYVLIFIFAFNKNAEDAEAELRGWIRKESDEWCGDDDDDGTERKASYIMLGTGGDRIQGPAFYVLVAGVTTDIEASVREWNETQKVMCNCIPFRRFGKKADWRRTGLLRFLGGLIDSNCLTSSSLEKQHRLPDEDEPSRR
jgi:hypothetical protein